MLKLQPELESVTAKFAANKGAILDWAKQLRESGDYNDFETRLAAECKYMLIGVPTVCEWYDKYDCNDSHVNNLIKIALRNAGI